MAKKKHKQQKRKPNGSALKSGQKTNWEAEARSVFNYKIKQYARDKVEIPDVYEGMDYEPQMLKRRIAAIAASVQDIKERFAPICPERTRVFSIEEDWIEINSYPNPSYDYEEQNAFTLLGAAIWILDQLRELDLISEASAYLPSDQEILGLEMPPVYDLCHSESMLQSMLSVLQNRNADCVGINPGKKDSEALIKRVFMDRYTVENKHNQDVPSRNRFEAILSLIPQKAIQSAVDTYTEKYWDFLERYFRSRNLFAQEEYELTKDTDRFDARADELYTKLERIKEGTKQRWEQGRVFTDMQGTVTIPVMPESEYMKLLKEAHEMEIIESRLTERREDLYSRLTSFWCEVGNFNAYSLDRLSDRFDDELIEIWDAFSKDGCFPKLQAALGYDRDHVWTEEERKRFQASHFYFSQAFQKLGGDELPITTADAMLEWLKVYPFSQIRDMSAQNLERSLEAMWPEIRTIGSQNRIEVHTQDLGNDVTTYKNRRSFSLMPSYLNVAFIHELKQEESNWVCAHEEGSRHLEEVLGDQVIVQRFFGVGTGEMAERAMEIAIKNGAEILFTTTAALITACRRVAARHPETRIFNCSVYMP